MDNQALKYERLANKHSTIGKVIEECAAYEEIGTVEEFRELKNKENPQKPLFIQRSVTQFYACPHCSNNEHYEHLFSRMNYCVNCGQALDWGDN